MVKKPVGRDLILRQDTHRRRITATLADAPKTKADCEKAKDIAAPAQSRVSTQIDFLSAGRNWQWPSTTRT
jgi:hypothetical protein